MNDLLVYNVLRNAAHKWPNLPAVYDEYGMLTFSELYSETEALKQELITLGICKGMGVGVMAKNGRNFISGIFAVIGCGATVMPMSHQLKQAEINEVLKEAQLHAILDDKSGAQPISNEVTNIPMNVDSFRFAFSNVDKSTSFAAHVTNPAFIRFTSGTTGKSKGVIISHQSAIERIDAANKALELGTSDVVVWVLPMAYHFVVSILLYIRFGTAIAIAKDFLSTNIIDITNEHGGTLLYASPMQIRLLSSNTDDVSMPSLKKVISTSAAISVDICKAFKQQIGRASCRERVSSPV